MAAQKKRIVQPRVKFGIRGVPTESFQRMKYYFQLDLEKKMVGDILKTWIKTHYSKKDAACILANPEYCFTLYSHFSAAAYWATLKLDIDPKVQAYLDGLDKYLAELKESGKERAEEKAQEELLPENVYRLSPRDHQMRKANDTIIEDLYALEDKWNAGELATYDIYAGFKAHLLPSSSAQFVKPFLERHYAEYKAAYDKEDKQLVEGYNHMSRKELKHRVDQCKQMIDDLDKLKVATKAVRQTKVKKPKAIDKQIAKIQYKKEDNEFKIASINPVKIVGAFRLYTFNTKTRALTEYVTEDVNGFEISGTSIKNFAPNLSRTVKLRKPEEFLQLVLTKTPKIVSSEWSKLSTKTTQANGRLNLDVVLLRALGK